MWAPYISVQAYVQSGVGVVRVFARCIFLLAGMAGGSAAYAQILIGQTAGITGTVAASVGEAITGANLVIDAVNARGGIHGEKIHIIRLDDAFDPARAAENARVLIEQHKVAALFMTRGTPHTLGILPLLEQHGVPLLAPSTGAIALHRPVQRHVFNVRTPYQHEAERVGRYLGTSIGMERVAVVYANDAFGQDAVQGLLKGLNTKPVASIAADRSQPDYASIVPQLLSAQVVVWLGSGTAVVGGVKALRRAGSTAQVVTLSNNASNGFIKALGSDGDGVIVMQVFPDERSRSTQLVRYALELAKDREGISLSPVMLEGVAAAQVLVEALRRAGPAPTRARIQTALEGLRNYDLGGQKLHISYSPSSHTGLRFTDLSIIKNGRFVR